MSDPITLPCGCKVTIGETDFERVCEPHRLAEQQDADDASRPAPDSRH